MLCQCVIVGKKKNWAKVDTGALCDCFPLGCLEGFGIETFNSKEEGSGFFQVTHLAVCLTLNLPGCCFPYRLPHLSAAVSHSYCLTGNLLSLCPTDPLGSVSMLFSALVKKSKGAKGLCLSSSSHAPLFVEREIRRWQQTNVIWKETMCSDFRNPSLGPWRH